MSQSAIITHKRSIRDFIANKLVSLGKPIYAVLRHKRKPWGLTKNDLKTYPSNTLAYHLYLFLDQNELKLMPRAEFHDVYHVLFQKGISMREETSIQFVVIGNGKWSLPNLISSAVSIVFYPEYWGEYKKAYLYGKQAKIFYDLNFKEALDWDMQELRYKYKLIDT